MTTKDNPVSRALHTFLNGLGRVVSPSESASADTPVVFAVSHCHPTRIVLYAAAFQGGWKIEFFNSLAEVRNATRSRRPRAVFYEHTSDAVQWDQTCAEFASQSIPFIFKGRRTSDDTFLLLLASGGYYAAGEPLRSEEIVKAVELADELTGMPHAVH